MIQIYIDFYTPKYLTLVLFRVCTRRERIRTLIRNHRGDVSSAIYLFFFFSSIPSPMFFLYLITTIQRTRVGLLLLKTSLFHNFLYILWYKNMSLHLWMSTPKFDYSGLKNLDFVYTRLYSIFFLQVSLIRNKFSVFPKLSKTPLVSSLVFIIRNTDKTHIIFLYCLLLLNGNRVKSGT